MADRCAHFMVEAYPTADIDITQAEAIVTNRTTIEARVEGAVRTYQGPRGPPSHRLEVECRFESGVLSTFRWTKGPR
jgi:hypothetical protein